MNSQINLGRVVTTRGVADQITDSTTFAKLVTLSLARHSHGDWGDLGNQDKRSNDQAVKVGERVLSAYTCDGQPKIWIITEWDRSVTTVLFPSEY